MCFSASASFTASAVLSMIGLITIRQCRRDVRKLPAATIPLLFGLQQAAEGMVWLGFYNNRTDLISFFSYIFLGVAMIGWPVIVPYGLYVLENNKERARYLKSLFFLGIVLSVSLIGALLLVPIQVSVQQHHIVYYISLSDGWTWFGTALYVMATLVPFFVSTQSYAWLFGALLIVADVVSYWSYAYAHFSVWCFMAALLSVLILLVLSDRRMRR